MFGDEHGKGLLPDGGVLTVGRPVVQLFQLGLVGGRILGIEEQGPFEGEGGRQGQCIAAGEFLHFLPGRLEGGGKPLLFQQGD